MLLHEAVHIWQIVKRRMGEREPSVEFEAYSIQAIAQDLLKCSKQVRLKTWGGREQGRAALVLKLKTGR